MRRTPVPSSLLLIMALSTAVLSGCAAESEPKPKAAPPATPAPTPTVDESTGSISGIVVDEEQRPVSRAEVLALKVMTKAETDDAGRFTINDLAPDTYQLVVQRLGYEEATLRVEVSAGAIAEPKIVLREIAINEAYHRVFPGSVYIVVGYSDFHRATALRNITCQPCELWVHTPPSPTDGVFEPEWQRSVSLPLLNEKFAFGIRANAVNGSIIATGVTVWQGVLTSRQVHQFTEAQMETYGKSKVTMVLVNVPSDNLGFNQRVNFWLSLAYFGPLPAGHTALPPS